MKIYTIGFTKKSAEFFFETLKSAGVRRLVDIRLNNISQLAGFSKKDDLRYFLKEICGIDYVHEPLLAPTQEILDEYKKSKAGWEHFRHRFLHLMMERKVEVKIGRGLLDSACLLCSEDKPDHCHRRFVAEYLRGKWGGVKIEHLL